MSESSKNTHTGSNEITLKELILNIQKYSKEVLRNWLLVFLAVIPFVAFFLYKAFTTPPTYSGQLTFMVNEDEGGGIGGAMAILSQFGFGGGGGGKYNLEKILDLSKSRKIIQQTLFDSLVLNGKDDLIANHLIDLYKYHEKWEDSEIGLVDFKFTHNNIPTFSGPENAALLQLYVKIVGSKKVEGMYAKSLEEDTGIMTLMVTSEEESMTIKILNSIYENLSKFYVNKTIEKQQATFDVVADKVDSLKTELSKLEYALANFQDTNRGLWTNKSELRQKQLARNVQVLNLMYGEALKNREIADFSLKSKTPFIQLIDAPIAPITPEKESKVKAVILGGILGGFLIVCFILGRKIVRDAMKEDIS